MLETTGWQGHSLEKGLVWWLGVQGLVVVLAPSITPHLPNIPARAAATQLLLILIHKIFIADGLGLVEFEEVTVVVGRGVRFCL